MILVVVILAVSAVQAQNCISGTGAGQCCQATRYGACFKVHGRYGIYVENNGIWIIGTKRLLSTAGDEKLDDMIYAAGGSFDHGLAGDFVVCPMSKYLPEHSQAVCVQRYSNLRVVERK